MQNESIRTTRRINTNGRTVLLTKVLAEKTDTVLAVACPLCKKLKKLTRDTTSLLLSGGDKNLNCIHCHTKFNAYYNAKQKTI